MTIEDMGYIKTITALEERKILLTALIANLQLIEFLVKAELSVPKFVEQRMVEVMQTTKNVITHFEGTP